MVLLQYVVDPTASIVIENGRHIVEAKKKIHARLRQDMSSGEINVNLIPVDQRGSANLSMSHLIFFFRPKEI